MAHDDDDLPVLNDVVRSGNESIIQSTRLGRELLADINTVRGTPLHFDLPAHLQFGDADPSQPAELYAELAADQQTASSDMQFDSTQSTDPDLDATDSYDDGETANLDPEAANSYADDETADIGPDATYRYADDETANIGPDATYRYADGETADIDPDTTYSYADGETADFDPGANDGFGDSHGESTVKTDSTSSGDNTLDASFDIIEAQFTQEELDLATVADKPLINDLSDDVNEDEIELLIDDLVDRHITELRRDIRRLLEQASLLQR